MTEQVAANPIVLQRADPHVLRHDGQYYFTGSYPAYDRVVLRRAERLEDLQAAPEVTIWTRHATGPQSHLIWAPEIHRVGDAWYVYYAAAPNDHGTADVPGTAETFNHRVFVLECTDADPMTGEWVERGQVDTGWESFALDATTFVLDGTQYLVWAQQDFQVRGHSNLYIAPMANPWTLAGPAVELTRPEFDWEVKGFWVNEGPSVLVRDGRVLLTYSGAATGIDYAMGVLTADATADLLDPASWSKSADPVFVSDPSVQQYGPGHNSFTESPEGETVLVYHARSYTEIVGDPLWDPNRHACAQVLPFDAEGNPVWGTPAPLTRPVPASTDVLTPDGTAVVAEPVADEVLA
ncbi:family 43 glycosylhydrolase [Isoptericola dokdonensis]|jgi:GH43 family beta-xylosidase|uniref:Extracellular exo-alpha-(1->5)-L-arabinofuranosidase n=1 Tax=Isoptericola dokdonensis DS-3 TaxID=1300344 RepID=A0A161I1X7_9MICO|nr:family 43 glycosylhydrolase [Isoptericola dokdonensis]ANC31405.1 Extracellular exo-alpha-(1->5)-L-arabinofuranosidase precursor [Isoptericola dokdonensis DS-3]